MRFGALLLSLLVCGTAVPAMKVEVTVGCCPLIVASRYHGMQFAGGMAAKKNDDGVIRPNDPVWNKLRQSEIKAEGVAHIDGDVLVLEFARGTAMPRGGFQVDSNVLMAPPVAAKLGLRIDGLEGRNAGTLLKPGTYAVAASATGGLVVRIPLRK